MAISLACGGDGENVYHVDLVSTISSGRDIEMVSMPGGDYVMGSTLYEPIFFDTVSYIPAVGELIVDTVMNIERPIHFVQLSSFMIGTTEITQEQYAAVMGANPSHYRSESNLPVESVSWFEAVNYCNSLSDLLGYSRCYDRDYNCDYSADGFRLPTEAEWEYAARAGTDTEYSNGKDSLGLSLIAWYIDNSEHMTHQVATKVTNAAGLYDMNGNVSEWCQDYFNFYNCGMQSDPAGPELGALRLTRGGSWADKANDCRSAARKATLPTSKISIVGFRIVRRN